MKRSDTKSKIRSLEKLVNALLVDEQMTHGIGRALRSFAREIMLYKNHLKGVKNWQDKKSILSTRRIQIGGGRHILEGFLNVDIVQPADLIYDVREGLPFADECSEYIFTEHFLEHLDYPISVKKFIQECYRVLKTGGKLVMGVPDSKLAINSYVRKDTEFYERITGSWYSKRNFFDHLNTYIDLLNYHFRDQDDDPKYSPHLWAYDYEKLDALLKWVGFRRVKKWNFDKSIANPERKYGSIYVVATK